MFRLLLIVSVLVLTLASHAAIAQTGSAFTYQGQLRLQGSPYSGTADYSFTLWDALTGGDPVGTAALVPGVTVSGGLFTVPLDFGSDTFSGGRQRYLEIAVRTPAWNGQGQPPAFTTLDPRQAITASPYSIQTRGIFVGADPQRVGIGTTYPLAGFGTEYPEEWKGLHVGSLDDGVRAVGLFEGTDWSRLHLRNAAALTNAKNFAIDNTGGLASFRWLNDDLSLRSQPMTFAPNGNVGIGIGGAAAPSATLQVRKGPAGMVTGYVDAPLVVENNTHAYINLLTPDAYERGILFGSPIAGATAGGFIYNSAATPEGFQFRTGGNVTRMMIGQTGNVGIGTTAPTARLHINGTPGIDGIRFPDGTLQTSAATSISPEPNLLMVRGYYDVGAGTVTGAGFTVDRIQQGIYSVTFSRPWASVPAVVVTGTGTGIGATASPYLGGLNTWTVITLTSANGIIFDSSFSLIAIGVPQ